MIDMLFAAKNKSELDLLHQRSYALAWQLKDDDWAWHLFSDASDTYLYLNDGGQVDFSGIDVTMKDGIEAAQRVRESCSNAFIMLLADENISPVEYLKPSIMPGALVMRPLSKEKLSGVLKDALIKMLRLNENVDDSKMFAINTKDGRKIIPYSQIYYFEARQKKIFCNTLNQEYGFYDTIDSLQGTLPAGFVRCHRSFIVAKSKIENIFLSNGYIELEGGLSVPLSRTYKSQLKGIMR